MRKLFNLIAKVPKDKLLHFICGENIALVLMIVLMLFLPIHLTCIVSFIAVFLIAVGKEFYDKLTGHKTEILDVVATILGGIIGIILSII